MRDETVTRRLFAARGTWTALVTPFLGEDGAEVDWATLDVLVDEQVRCGVDAIVPCGTTGESATLSHEEHDRVIEHVVRRAAGRAAVVAGTGSNCTAEAIRLTTHAAESGADAVLVVAPYYNRPSQRMLVEHYSRIAERSAVPLVLYDVPSRTGVRIEPETVAELRRRHPRSVAGLKDASGSLDSLMRLHTLSDIPVLCGDDALTLPMMALGATGVISVASNVAPRVVVHLVRSAAAGDFAAARSAHERMLPLVRALFREPNPVPVKAALKILERGNGIVRPPLCTALPETESALRDAMSALELLPQR
jgi:4-hydroxy-tetrahydrodipicolinate synthase